MSGDHPVLVTHDGRHVINRALEGGLVHGRFHAVRRDMFCGVLSGMGKGLWYEASAN